MAVRFNLAKREYDPVDAEAHMCEKHVKMFSVSMRAVIAFVVTLGICTVFIAVMVVNRSRVERLVMEQLIMEKGIKISEVMTRLLYKTNMLSSFIIQNDGDTTKFDEMASTIIDDPAILNLLVAPRGVVTNVYPLEGNESVVGLDFFAEGKGNKEAIMAVKTGALVLGGPFDAVQGGQILVGRLPVFMDDEEGGGKLWGLVSVTLKYPQTLDAAGLDELILQGFAYELWRLDPDTGEKQIISGSGGSHSPRTNYVERELSIANATWYFRMLPVRAWYEFMETWVSFFVSLCMSILIAIIIENNRELKILKDKLEILSNTDPLTGVYNRRGFRALASVQTKRLERAGGSSFVMIIDIDYFKSINDMYGHQTGDIVLKEVAARAQGNLRSYDLFARFGGEEFVILVLDIDEESAFSLANRIRMDICGSPIRANKNSITTSISIGVSQAAPVSSLEDALEKADKALYTAKKGGRNIVVYET